MKTISPTKYVYLFDEVDQVKELLDGDWEGQYVLDGHAVPGTYSDPPSTKLCASEIICP